MTQEVVPLKDSAFLLFPKLSELLDSCSLQLTTNAMKRSRPKCVWKCPHSKPQNSQTGWVVLFSERSTTPVQSAPLSNGHQPADKTDDHTSSGGPQGRGEDTGLSGAGYAALAHPASDQNTTAAKSALVSHAEYQELDNDVIPEGGRGSDTPESVGETGAEMRNVSVHLSPQWDEREVTRPAITSDDDLTEGRHEMLGDQPVVSTGDEPGHMKSAALEEQFSLDTLPLKNYTEQGSQQDVTAAASPIQPDKAKTMRKISSMPEIVVELAGETTVSDSGTKGEDTLQPLLSPVTTKAGSSGQLSEVKGGVLCT